MKQSLFARCRAALMLGMLALSGIARAEPPTPQPLATTWQEASPEARQAAEALFAEGSRLFTEWQFAQAEERYRAALTYWKHPLVYLYLSRAMERQGDLVGAYETLQKALRHEPLPFSADDLQVTGKLKEELESRLAWIEVDCNQAGAEVWFDGKIWFKGPGQPQRVVRPGQYLLTARKAGFMPVTRLVSLKPGSHARVELRMSLVDGDVARHGLLWDSLSLGEQKMRFVSVLPGFVTLTNQERGSELSERGVDSASSVANQAPLQGELVPNSFDVLRVGFMQGR
jgi:hypothetical protein